MGLSKEQRAEQCRKNGRCSRGPISAAGKKASSMSACKHYMRAEKLYLPSESPELIQEHVHNWISWYQPQSPAAVHLMNVCIHSTLLCHRTWGAFTGALASQTEDAQQAWEAARQATVANQSAALPGKPAEALAALKQSGHGCRFVLERLHELGGMLARDGHWPLELSDTIVNLFGSPSGIDQLGASETGYRIYVYNLHCLPQTAETIGQMAQLSEPARRPLALRGADLKSWLPAPEVCREWLRGMVAAEIQSLGLLEEAIRTGKDASEYDRLMEGAKLLPEGETSRQVLRYGKEADSKFLKNFKEFKQTLAADARNADVDDSRDSSGAGAGGFASTEPAREAVVVPEAGAATIGTTVTTVTTEAPGPGRTGKVDSPNDPDDGGIVTTGAMNRVGNGVLVVLLAVLLGQLFLGLGRRSAEAKPQTTPERPRAEGAGTSAGVSGARSPRTNWGDRLRKTDEVSRSKLFASRKGGWARRWSLEQRLLASAPLGKKRNGDRRARFFGSNPVAGELDPRLREGRCPAIVSVCEGACRRCDS